MVEFEMNIAKDYASDLQLLKLPKFSHQIQKNAFWNKDYSTQIQSRFKNAFIELEENIVKIYNNPMIDEDHFRALSKTLYAIIFIKPIVTNKLHERYSQNSLKLEQYLNFFFQLFMNKLRSLESVERHVEFLDQYSKLWKLFLHGTILIDYIFAQFEVFKSNHMQKLRISGKNVKEEIDKEESYDEESFLNERYAGMAMKAWRETFFFCMNDRISVIIRSLIELEHSRDVWKATSNIPRDLIQSFKILDGFRQKEWWATSLRKDLDYHSLLVDVDKLDITQRISRLTPTMMDEFSENIVEIPSPTEKEIQEMFKFSGVEKQKKGVKKITRKKSFPRSSGNKTNCWRYRQRKSLKSLITRIALFIEKVKNDQLKMQLLIFHQELCNLRNQFSNESAIYFNEFNQIEAQLQPDQEDSKSNDSNDYGSAKQLYMEVKEIFNEIKRDMNLYKEKKKILEKMEEELKFYI
uniref:Uncharacterized protein n=1 Tax=Acrobeloides nanus TaxID=290746 RepID=A0A914D9V6_9BILA